jgi:two-component system, OmpR family, catabolic regulation response regulator CreB
VPARAAPALSPRLAIVPHLLLLEDDPAIARTVAYALGREGFSVEHVMLVCEARVRLAQANRYAAALLDVSLPDGSGFDLCRELRSRWPALPIVLLTARGEEMDRVLGLELGADDYVTKPFSPRELCARVRALLRRSAVSAQAPPQPTAGSAFEHDAQRQRIAYAGTWLTLTRIEYGLLATLLRSPGRIWSRGALLDAVWGEQADSTDRTVDTHIKTLRAKLREVRPQVEAIATHRGMGYSLDHE